MASYPNSRLRTALGVVAILATLGGCGGGGGTEAVTGGESDPGPGTTLPQGPSVLADYYVDADGGSDAATGAWDDPLETITHALSVAQAGERVHAYPGTYDAAGGEVFPLMIPDQVELIGNESEKGLGATATLIRGGALMPPSAVLNIEATVALQDGSALSGVVVINPNGYTSALLAGVTLLRSNAELRDCHVLDCLSAGVYVGKSCSGGALIGNVVARNGVGLYLAYGPNDGRIEGNIVTENKTGVWLLYAEPDFGGGAGGSFGENRLVMNTGRDLMVSKNRTIAAQDNFWDNAPPLMEVGTQVTQGADIFEADNTVSVDTTGSQLNTDLYTIPTFP